MTRLIDVLHEECLEPYRHWLRSVGTVRALRDLAMCERCRALALLAWSRKLGML